MPSGAPLFVSKPHFLDADPYYQSLVLGLSPNRTLHDTNVYVEPLSGITMQSYKRLQITIQVNVSLLYPHMSPAFVPVIWVEESGSITPQLASQFTGQVYTALDVSKALQWAGVIGGSLLLLCVTAIFLAILAPDRHPVGPALEDSETVRLLNGDTG